MPTMNTSADLPPAAIGRPAARVRAFVHVLGVALVALWACVLWPAPVWAQGYDAPRPARSAPPAQGSGAAAAMEPSAGRAPAGNAHPQTQDINPAGVGQANAFGEARMVREGRATPAEKAAFARQLDLTPLRDLAVFHNGRVKIFDTLASEMVQTITGKRRYDEPGSMHATDVREVSPTVAPKGEAAPNVAYDPVFTLLDMVIDPAYYLDKPLLGVNFLPLRREIVESEFKTVQGDGADDLVTKYLRLGRVTPLMADRWGPRIQQSHMGEPAYMEALGRTNYFMQLFGEAKANFEMVAPSRRDLPWQHISTLEENHPARAAALALGQAWRARDAAGANAAIATLAAELPKIHADVYPTTRRSLEMFYNRLDAFEWGWVLYAVSLVALLLAFGTHRRWLAWLGGITLAGGCIMHATGFIARCLIAERFAIQNQFESMTGLSLFAVVLALGIMLFRRQWLFGAAAAATGFMVLVTATQTAMPGQTIEREAAILNTSVLLKYHVTIVLVSYGLIALGFVIALFYLGAYYFGKKRGGPGAGQRRDNTGDGLPAGGRLALAGAGDAAMSVDAAALSAPSTVEVPLVSAALAREGEAPAATIDKTLADLDTAQMIVLQLAFWTLGVGILLGAWWADHSWGRWWAFDPKETWALITWIVYLIVIHARIAYPRNKATMTAWLSVVGFFIMLWTYFGVNLLLPGLHAYA